MDHYIRCETFGNYNNIDLLFEIYLEKKEQEQIPKYLLELLDKRMDRVNSSTFKPMFKNRLLKSSKNKQITLSNYFLTRIND